jgi:hypothetical protein
MRLDQVLKIGKPFKRRDWVAYYNSFDLIANVLTSNDVIADDWEHVTQKVEITIFDLERAFNEMLADPYMDSKYRIQVMAKELGFTE